VELTQGVAANTSVSMPVVGLGTYGYGWQPNGAEIVGGELWDDVSAESAVRLWIQNGGRRIDGALSYPTQIGVGRAISTAIAAGEVVRDDLFITSKIEWAPCSNWCSECDGVCESLAGSTDTGFEWTLRQYDQILARTGLEYIDLLLIHWPGHFKQDPALANIACAEGQPNAGSAKGFSLCRSEAWRAMVQLLSKRQVRAIGVSNFELEHLEDVKEGQLPAVNQVELHTHWHDADLYEECRQRGIHIQAYTPLGAPDHMSWPGDVKVWPHGSLPRANWPRLVANHTAVIEAANRIGLTPEQTVLRWAWQHYGASSHPRSRSAEHMRQNLAAILSDNDLNDAELKAISSIQGSEEAPLTNCTSPAKGIPGLCENKVRPTPKTCP